MPQFDLNGVRFIAINDNYDTIAPNSIGYVEAPDKSSGRQKQGIHVEYDLVVYIPVDELMKAEQA